MLTNNYLRLALLSGVLILGLLFQNTFAATASSPVQVLNTASQSMLAELRANRNAIRQGNTQILYNIVNRILLPHIAVDTMARTVVGPYHWKKATPRQRQQFISEFVKLVVSTYSTALSSYENQQVQFFPLRGDISRRRLVTVNSRIVHSNGTSIPVIYQMIRSDDNTWKVKDFSVDGVVLTRSYSSQFAQLLNEGGLPALITQLAKHNREER